MLTRAHLRQMTASLGIFRLTGGMRASECVFAVERVVFYTSPVHQNENSQGSFHPMGHGAGQHPFTISLGNVVIHAQKNV